MGRSVGRMQAIQIMLCMLNLRTTSQEEELSMAECRGLGVFVMPTKHIASADEKAEKPRANCEK